MSIRKSGLIILLNIILISSSFAYSTIQGNINSGTWTAGTYFISSDASIQVDSVLNIAAGVVIKFAPGSKINVYGKLFVNGISGNEVIFTSVNDNGAGEVVAGSSGTPKPGDYYYLGINGYAGQGECSAEYGIFRYGGKQYGNISYIQNSSGSLKNCLFEHSADNGLKIYQSEVSIDQCQFSHNAENGFYASYYSEPHITNSAFNDNGNYAIYLSTFHATTPYIGNTASNNKINGIVIRGNDAFDTNNSNVLYNSGLMPYVIEGNSPVYDTLRIEAGAIIKFMEGAYIYTGAAGNNVYGTIIANGTEEEPIIFTSLHNDSLGGDTNNNGDSTSARPGDWENIYILNGRGEFNHCKMSYGGETSQMLHYWNGGSGFFKNGEILSSANRGVYTNSPDVELDNNKIFHNGSEGIYLTGNSRAVISNNQINQNGGNGITCYSAAPTLSYNQINHNQGYAAYFQSALFRNTFENNQGFGNQINGFVVKSVSTDSSSTMGNSNTSLPFVFSGNVVTYGTLTFEAGTIVKFETANSYIYTVSYLEDSKVIVNGTEQNPVIFTSIKDDGYAGDTNADGTGSTAQAGDWKHIAIANNSTGEFNNCKILYGGSSGSVIYFGRNSKGYVKNSFIQNNAGRGLEVDDALINIWNCRISNNGSDGVYFSEDGGDDNSGSLFSANIVSGNDGNGIYFNNNSKTVVRDNKIEYNGGYGIKIRNSKPDLGGIENLTAADGGKNTFLSNDNNGYQIYNSGSDSIWALNNYWAWHSGDSIDAHIYDNEENSGSGEVDFSPWLIQLSAEFSADTTCGTTPFTVQFNDLSSGTNIVSWKWDFEDDGIFDSDMQNPEYTYSAADTYDVKLIISDGVKQDTLLKKSYIKVQLGTAIHDEALLPSSTQLQQNYPNPFNPSTAISYQLSDRCTVELTVYNMLGQRVQTLVNQKQNAGSYSVKFNAAGLASGVYFYKFNTGSFVQVHKMILIH